MKKYIFVIILGLLIVSCSNDDLNMDHRIAVIVQKTFIPSVLKTSTDKSVRYKAIFRNVNSYGDAIVYFYDSIHAYEIGDTLWLEKR